jgi:hypothetical protein
MAGYGLLGTLLPKSTAESLRLDMPIGDMLARLAKNETLSQFEIEELRLWGNQTQTNNSFVAGLQNGSSNVYANQVGANHFPMVVFYSNILEQDYALLTVNIPSSYRHIQIYATGRMNGTGGANGCDLYAVLNGDTGSNYTWEVHYGLGSTDGAGGASDTAIRLAVFSADGNAAGQAGSVFAVLPHYTSSLRKASISMYGNPADGASRPTAGSMYSFWNSTAAINQISFRADTGAYPSAKLEAGMAISIYGLL